MKRKLFKIQSVINNPYSAQRGINRCFKEDEGFDLSTKEGAGAFLKKNAEMILQMKEFKALQGEIETLQTKNTELEAKLSKVSALDKESKDWKDLVTEMKGYGLEIKALKDGSNRKGQFKKGTIAEFLQKNDAKIKEFLGKKGSTLMLEYKSDVLEDGTAIGSGDSFNTLGRDAYFTWHEGGAVGRIPVRRPFMRELIRNVTTGTEFIKYIDQDTITRNAQNVAYCGVTNSTTQVTFKVRTLQIQKIRDFIDVCLDMMSDYGFVQGEINRLLNESLDLKIDNDLLLGSGAAPVLNGIDSIASDFLAANNSLADGSLNYANAVPNAQIIDLISIMGAQIRQLGQQNMYYPNVVIMNPRDVQGIKQLKNSFGDYIRNSQLISSLFVDANGKLYIDGMMIVENPLVPANNLYIGDFTKTTIYSMPGIGIEFAYENRANFETEVVTVKIYERLNQLIRNVDKNAFMRTKDIGAAITSITKTLAP